MLLISILRSKDITCVLQSHVRVTWPKGLIYSVVHTLVMWRAAFVGLNSPRGQWRDATLSPRLQKAQKLALFYSVSLKTWQRHDFRTTFFPFSFRPPFHCDETQQNLGMLVQGYISLPFPDTLNLPKQTSFTRAAHIQHGAKSGNAWGERRSRLINSAQSKDKSTESPEEEHRFYSSREILTLAAVSLSFWSRRKKIQAGSLSITPSEGGSVGGSFGGWGWCSCIHFTLHCNQSPEKKDISFPGY